MLELSRLPPAILEFSQWLCSSYLFVFLQSPEDTLVMGKVQSVSQTVSIAHLHPGPQPRDTQQDKHWPPEGQPPSRVLRTLRFLLKRVLISDGTPTLIKIIALMMAHIS